MELYKKGVAFVVEATSGCRMNCLGCKINKDLPEYTPPEHFERIKDFALDLHANGVPLTEFEIGPTDLIAASNRKQILADSNLRQTAGLFEMVTVNASFSYADPLPYERLAKDLNVFAPGKKLGLQVPINLKNLDNKKYLSLVLENVRTFIRSNENETAEVIFTIIVDDLLVGQAALALSYTDLEQRCSELRALGYGVDLISHHGLSGLKSVPARADFEWTLKKFNIALSNVMTGQAKDHTKRFKTLMDAPESLELVFNNGDLYFRPTLREKSNVFHEEYRITCDWTAEQLSNFMYEKYMANIEYAGENNVCKECTRSIDCSRRFVPGLMNLLRSHECIVGLRQE